jgi:hypothetical protein
MSAFKWAVAAVCMGLAVGHARANVTYQFNETSYSPLPVTLPDIVLSDAAVAAGGVTVSYICPSSCTAPIPDPAAVGYLEGIGAQPEAYTNFDLNALVVDGQLVVNLDYYLSNGFDFELHIHGSNGSAFVTAGPDPQQQYFFTGQFEQVPEPAPALILGPALLALIACRRRLARSADA